jgi:hypothetical protein
METDIVVVASVVVVVEEMMSTSLLQPTPLWMIVVSFDHHSHRQVMRVSGFLVLSLLGVLVGVGWYHPCDVIATSSFG